MESITPGSLVKVARGGPDVDGIVFDTPSRTKVVVAIVDPAQAGPGFRTVHPDTLSERDEEGPDDRALHLLIRRTPPPAQRGGRAGATLGQGREGHRRASMHRTTGK